MRKPGIKHLQLLLTPSWLSGLLDVTVVLSFFAVAFLGLHYSGSTLEKTLLSVSSTSANTYQQFTSKFADNRIITNLPLFLFWAFVGLIVYYFATAIYGAFHQAAEIRAELGYVNIKRSDLLSEAIVHLIVRVTSLIVWLVYAHVFFQSLLPYALTNVHTVATSDSAGLGTSLTLIGTVLFVILSLHIHTIFLRLVVLRPRTFGGSYYD